MKRQHKIATIRRLVALTMLFALLFSSTAVYADTADYVEGTSEEVVIETGNTSNDTNSSTNQYDTVSGSDSNEIDSTTTIEYDEVSDIETSYIETSDNGTEGIDNEDSDEPLHEHTFDDTSVVSYIAGKNGEHYVYKTCTTCGEAVYVDSEDCVMSSEGRAYENIDDDSTHHLVRGVCQSCGVEMTATEDCSFTIVSGNRKYCSHEECENEQDARSNEPLITLSYTDINGDSIDPTSTLVNKKNREFKVLDGRVVITAKIQCETFNDRNATEWEEGMNVSLTVYTGSTSSEVAMSFVSYDSESYTATYKWVSPEYSDSAITVSQVKASYKVLKKNRWGIFAKFFPWNYRSGSSTQDIRYIIRTIDASTQINNLSNDSIIGGTWQMDNSHVWYSNALEGHTDTLRATFSGMTINEVSDLKLEELGSNAAQTLKATSVNSEAAWSNDGNAFIGWNNTITFELPTDVEGEHEYSLVGKISNKTYSNASNIKTYIDNTAPTYTVAYNPSEAKNEKYYNKDVEIKVVADDAHLDYSISSISVSGHEDDIRFSEKDDTAATTVTEETNHILTGVIYDLAGNSTKIADQKEFIVDKTAPVVTVKFDNHDVKHGKYYKADRVASVTVFDVNIDSNEANIANVVINAADGSATTNQMSGSDGKYSGSIVFDQDGTYILTGFNFEDKAGNKCVISEESDDDYNAEFVIDKTVPTIKVSFDNNSAQNDIYYKAARTAEIIINEKNFTSDQVSLSKTSGDLITLPGLQGYSISGDENITKLTFDKDGRYGFSLVCEDLAGNISETYVNDDFVIDTTAPELEITGVTNMSANNGVVKPVIKSVDANINEYSTEITLTGSNNGTVSPEIITAKGTEVFTYAISDLAHEKSNDDLYTLDVKLVDFAGNVVEKSIVYSINRFGSIYVLSEATKAMVDNYYVTNPQDVVITEINIDSLSYKEVSVAYDGNVKELREGSDYTASDLTNANKWHSISYTISASNFKKDGLYAVTIYSEDKATNKQSNQSKDAEIQFLMDATAPSVVVSGIEDGGVYEEDSHDFSINAVDTIGVEKMSVLLNGEKLGEYSDKELSENGGTVVLTIPSKDDYQKVEIICSDIAGNKTNLAYNNILVSVKAEELLLSDELTPTSKLDDGLAASIASKSNRTIFIIIAIIAVAAVGCGVAVTSAGGIGSILSRYRKK